MTVTILEQEREHQTLPDTTTADQKATTRETYPDSVNPVLETSQWAMKASPHPALYLHTHLLTPPPPQEIGLVGLHEDGVASAARYICAQMQRESYTPRTWRTHPLHLCPAEPVAWGAPSTRACLDWVFLISSLNFSFWSEREGTHGRYGVEWRAGWDADCPGVVHTGYWSLVAAVDRGACYASRIRRGKKPNGS